MRVREVREAKGVSRAELSRRTGIHIRTLEDLEKSNDCLVSTAKVIAAALDVTLDELTKNQ